MPAAIGPRPRCGVHEGAAAAEQRGHSSRGARSDRQLRPDRLLTGTCTSWRSLLDLGKAPRLGTPRRVVSGASERLRLDMGFDVAPDGLGFVAAREVPDPKATVPTLTLVESWFAEFQEPAGRPGSRDPANPNRCCRMSGPARLSPLDRRSRHRSRSEETDHDRPHARAPPGHRCPRRSALVATLVAAPAVALEPSPVAARIDAALTANRRSSSSGAATCTRTRSSATARSRRRSSSPSGSARSGSSRGPAWRRPASWP